MRIAVIVNPVAGSHRGDPRHRDRQRRLVEHALSGVDTVEMTFTEARGHATALARAAVDGAADLVIAWGGDGTINEVVQGLAFSGVPLAIVPAGSGNGLARELGVAARPERALADALTSGTRTLDVGEIGGRLFANVAGLGFDAEIAHAFNLRRGRTQGLATYAWLSLVEGWGYEPRHYAIDTPDGRIETTAILVALANSAQYGNGAKVAPAACPDDGWLDLVVVEPTSPMHMLWRARRLFDGTVSADPHVTTRRVREVTFAAPVHPRFHVDGEPCDATGPLTARVHPAALVVKASTP